MKRQEKLGIRFPCIFSSPVIVELTGVKHNLNMDFTQKEK